MLRSATTQSPPASRSCSTEYSPVATLSTRIPAPWPGLDVERRVADRDRALAVEARRRPRLGAVERLAADVDPGVRVRAVAAEGEEAVEVGAGELGVRGGLGVAGDQADQPALAA